ncbi:MAG: sigma-70 family RNA polymerase sigma factor, partial [Candidatus Eisenbacteria bacterium]|nr:sigma-70 family RNA polymerase sigma factor [Candidatus Eisenbacteria bacterium]
MMRPTDNSSDDALIRRVAGGDLGAFDEVVRRYQKCIWNAALRFTGDAVEAEDLAQETFLRALTAKSPFQSTGSLRAYLLRIVGRLCIDRSRKKRPIYTDQAPDPQSTDPSPSQIREDDERCKRVRAALLTLPPKQRVAIVLKYYDGLRHAEIAGVIGGSEKAVERHLARARESLRRLLPDEEGC